MPGKLTKQQSLSTASSDPSQRIKILTAYGSQVEIDKTLAVKLYFRSGKEMLRMANMYCDEDQLESAFILYYKFITLFVEKLPSHPDYRSSPSENVADYKRKVKKVFPIAEEIKKKLKQRYVMEEELYLEEQKRLDAERFLQEERRRKEREEQERKDEEMARRIQEEENDQIRESLEAAYRKMQLEEKEKKEQEEEKANRSDENQTAVGVIPGGVAVAGVAATSVLPGGPGALGLIPESDSLASDANLPPPPSYSQYLTEISGDRPNVPDRNLKKNVLGGGSVDPAVPPPQAAGTALPTVDRSTKPSIDHHMSLGGFGGHMGGLRNVVVPATLMDSFLAAAESNTRKESETMGILCGKMTQGVFKITHLFIPKQTGGHDSCDMENEEELIFYQDEFNLITLGWIHTHPTQTAFLSSVDLHSHFPWQKMMPEAIAIVCSPKFNESGIFKLTDRGLDVIGSCRQTGFHPHSKDPPLFEICPHVQLSEVDNVQVVDKRC